MTGSARIRGGRWVAGVAVVAMAVTGACGGDDEDTADFCETYREYEDRNEEVGQDFAENPEDVDLEETKELFRDLATQIEDLAGEAPEEIADDVRTVSDATAELAEAVDAAEDPEGLVEATTSVAEDEEATEASERVDEWTQDNCDSDGAR